MFRRYFQIHSFRFSLSTHCEQLEPVLALLFPTLSTTSGKCCAKWSIERSGGTGTPSYACYEDGKLIHETKFIDDALDELEWRITKAMLDSLVQFVQLHAAGLAAGGRALLLIGPSGAGKSSLALCMLRQGWKCLSDEIILIDAASGAVWPFPRCFRVDFKTMGIFPELLVKQDGSVCCDFRGKVRLTHSFNPDDWVTGASLPEWIIFPNYRPDHRGELEPLGETEAFSLMLSQAINLVDHGKKGLDILMSLVRRFQCFRLNTGDLDTATSLLAGLTKQIPTPVCSFPLAARDGFMKRTYKEP